MNEYDASEQSYKNGFDKGYRDGKFSAYRAILNTIEKSIGKRCDCERLILPFYDFCPYCGREV